MKREVASFINTCKSLKRTATEIEMWLCFPRVDLMDEYRSFVLWNFLCVSKSTHSTLLKITDSFGRNDAKILKALFLFCLFSFRNTKLIAVSLVWSAQTRVVKKLHCKKTFKSTWARNALCGRNCVNTAKQASFFAKERWKLLLKNLQRSG